MFAQRVVIGFAAVVASMLALGTLQAATSNHVVIGTVDQNAGQAWLTKSLLKQQFADGGQINHLRVRQYPGGYDLLRIGHAADGSCRTESIPLTLSGNRLVATAVRWFTVCSSSSCTGFCTPNSSRSACNCDSGGLDDSGPSDQLSDFDVENEHTGGTQGNCNFGMDVSGMGLSTLIIN